MDSEIDRRMLEAVVQIGRSLHIATIAEAVETERCFRELKDIGIDYVQGHFPGKPRPLEHCVADISPPLAETAQ